MDYAVIALVIMGIALILYITELMPIATTSLLVCLAMAAFGVIPLNIAFAGFANDILFLMAGMMVVGTALFETGVAQILGKKIISLVGTNEKVFLLALILVGIAISGFLSNTATAAIMLPLAASAISASKGKFSKKNTFMIVGLVAAAGGGLTLVGSTPQLIAQGILQDGGHDTMGFFDIAVAGGPILVLLSIYALTIGYSLQKRVFNFAEIEDEHSITDEPEGEQKPKSVVKMCIAVTTLVFCVAGFILNWLSPGIISMIGAVACIATGCISEKRSFEKMNWTTIIIFGCSFGFAAGLEHSGAGQMIANGTITLLGDNISPWLLAAVLALVATILGNFMSSTATAALLIPISVLIAIEMDYNVLRIAMAMAIACNLGFATPMSTPPLTMTMSAGYRFKDYLIVGGLFNLLAYGLLLVIFLFIL